MSSAPTAEEIARDATWLAQALDPSAGTVRLVAMDRESYRSASFLDDRLMQHPVDAQIVPWPDVETALTGDLRTDARWIFHIGHVGSTLVSRLLGELENVLSIREPRLLRDVAISPDGGPQNLCRRSPQAHVANLRERRDCVREGDQLCERDRIAAGSAWRARALHLRHAPQLYRNDPCRRKQREGAPCPSEFRRQRLAARGIELPAPQQRRGASGCRLGVRNDDVWNRPPKRWRIGPSAGWISTRCSATCRPNLSASPTLFGFAATEDRLAKLATGPLMSRYSKDMSYEYSPALRHQLIEQEDAPARARDRRRPCHAPMPRPKSRHCLRARSAVPKDVRCTEFCSF